MRLTLIILFSLMLSPKLADAWGFYAHKKINHIAIFSLPPEMLGFYKKHLNYIVLNATAPDQRRYVVDGEAPRHYLDIDHYGSYPFTELPHDYDSAVAKYSLDTILAHGIVPWHIQVMYWRLVKAFKDEDPKAILKNSAEIGHYIADACVPLHASSNHNGQHTGQEGIHGLWESRIPELYEEDYFDLFVGHAFYIDRVGEYTWDMFLESARLSDTVLHKEQLVTEELGSDQKYLVTERGPSNVIRTYDPDFVMAYMQSMDDMVESRMRTAIKSTASYWMSAWIEAGQPDLNGQIDIEISDPELEHLNKIWTTGEGYGRKHE